MPTGRAEYECCSSSYVSRTPCCRIRFIRHPLASYGTGAPGLATSVVGHSRYSYSVPYSYVGGRHVIVGSSWARGSVHHKKVDTRRITMAADLKTQRQRPDNSFFFEGKKANVCFCLTRVELSIAHP
eukprot:scaffold31930_cov24-Prasinocladus_malaysianus.AAC.2